MAQKRGFQKARGPQRGAPPAAAVARELVIEGVGAQGDGVAAGPTYVPLTLPGERVRAARVASRTACPRGWAPARFVRSPTRAWRARVPRVGGWASVCARTRGRRPPFTSL